MKKLITFFIVFAVLKSSAQFKNDTIHAYIKVLQGADTICQEGYVVMPHRDIVRPFLNSTKQPISRGTVVSFKILRNEFDKAKNN